LVDFATACKYPFLKFLVLILDLNYSVGWQKYNLFH